MRYIPILVLALSGCTHINETLPENCSARYAAPFAAHVQAIWKWSDPRCNTQEDKR